MGETEAMSGVSNYLAFYSANYRYHPKFKAKLWDGKIRFFNARHGTIPTGLVPCVVRYFERFGDDVNIEVSDQNDSFKDTGLTVDKDIFIETEWGNQLFPDQVFAINHLLKSKRGIAELATGFGKTALCGVMCKTIIDNDDGVRKSLIIVPRIDLVSQTHDALVSMGLNATMYYGTKKTDLGDIVVATWQSLQNDLSLMAFFQLVIIDEGHETSETAIQMKKIMDAATNAVYRYSITGTMSKQKASVYTLMGITGDVKVQIDTKTLQDLGRLTNCQVVRIVVSYSKEKKKELRKIIKEDEKIQNAVTKEARGNLTRLKKLRWLSEQEERTDIVKSICDQVGPTIVIVNNKFEGMNVQNAVEGSVFITQTTTPPERKILYAAMREGKLNNIAGSYQLVSTGLDIPNLKNIIFFSPSGAFIRVVQSIGRTLRVHDDKSMAYIYDIEDGIEGMARSAKARMDFYEEKKFPVKTIEVSI